MTVLLTWGTRAARRAIDRCYGVPYRRELSNREYRQMLRLERAGIVRCDKNFADMHWHLTDKGKLWLTRNAHGWTSTLDRSNSDEN